PDTARTSAWIGARTRPASGGQAATQTGPSGALVLLGAGPCRHRVSGMSSLDSDGASPPAGEGAISLRNVVKRFGQIVAVDGLDLDVELTCRQVLTVFARLYRVPGAQRAAAVEKALELANLGHRADTIVRELSGGMRRRLLVARGLIHRPRLVLLDEPTVGLDPQVRQELWSLIDRLRAEGVTLLMSTHYIEEAERLADMVAVMSGGRIIAQGTPAELVRAFAGEEVLEVYGRPERLVEVGELALRNGWSSRRTGPALAILRAECLDGQAPE